ncbi:uncharacterized protein LOC105834503 [Monomorium pharaonis]|uniref:uncharacterized protein LOC105834503 n=1 Tax=Monomorium pharaonis TaxID=307658 RepID=UPI00063F73EC|nr:uncharacterized protein LOC105834503 [Monomorium pharaonis]
MNNIKLEPFGRNIKLNFHRVQDCPHRTFLIALTSVAFVTVILSQHTSDQSVILKNFMKHQNQRDKVFKYLTLCTATFIKEYFEDLDQISFFLPDVLPDDISDVVEPLMNDLRVTRTIYILNVSQINVTDTYNILTNVVILSESGIALEVNDSSFINYCEYDCNFVIVLTNLFNDKESFLMEAGIFVQQMSLRSIFKLEILASVGDSVLLASSLPVRTNESYALAEPAYSGRCDIVGATAIRWQHFANKTKSLLDTSTVNAAMFNNFPFTFFINDINRFGGVEGSMVEEIAHSINIKLNREIIEWTQTTMQAELYLRLYNATNDLVFGGILWDSSRKVAYTTCYGMVHISWIVPVETNVSLRGLIAPFNKDIWFAIICVLIVGGLVKLFFIRDITFLDIAALIFGVSVFRRPTKTSSRIQFLSWTVFSFFLTQLYLGSLADHLISTSDMQIESMEELVNSGLKIGGTQRFVNLFVEVPNKADVEDHVGQMIRKKVFILKQQDYNNQFLDLVEGRNTSLALLVMLNLTKNHRQSNIGHGHIIKETVGSFPLAFVTRKGFPYLREFNFKILLFVQAGLVEFWSNLATLNKIYYKMEDEEDDDSKIDINDIAPAFLLLIIGYLGGCCLLIIEVIFYPSKWFR